MKPVEQAIGRWLGVYFSQLVPLTPAMDAYCARPLERAIAFVPGRMVDSAQEMLNLWTRNDSKGGPTTPADMPVILVAVAQDMTTTGRDYTIQVADPVKCSIPDDPKERVFELRTSSMDYRVQLLFCAHDPDTARALAAQFALFVDTPRHKTLQAVWRFAGIDTEWPVKLESPDVAAMRIQTEAKNLTMLALDGTLKATIPLYRAPGAGEPNDGKGSGTKEDPHGFPVVSVMNVESNTDERFGQGLTRRVADADGIHPTDQGGTP